MRIAGVEISKKAAEAIATEAIVMADQRGYCAEVEDMLSDMGFPIPSFSKTVTLEVQVSGTGRPEFGLDDSYNWTAYVGGNSETDSIKVVSVK